MASQTVGRGFKPRLAPLNFPKFMCEFTLEIYHELYGEGKRETCTNLRWYVRRSQSVLGTYENCGSSPLILSGQCTAVGSIGGDDDDYECHTLKRAYCATPDDHMADTGYMFSLTGMRHLLLFVLEIWVNLERHR